MVAFPGNKLGQQSIMSSAVWKNRKSPSALDVPGVAKYEEERGPLLKRQLKGYCDAASIHGLRYLSEERRPICERQSSLGITFVLIVVLF